MMEINIRPSERSLYMVFEIVEEEKNNEGGET